MEECCKFAVTVADCSSPCQHLATQMVFQLWLHQNGSPGGCKAAWSSGAVRLKVCMVCPVLGWPGTPSAARRFGLMHTHTSAVLAVFNTFALIWQVWFFLPSPPLFFSPESKQTKEGRHCSIRNSPFCRVRCEWCSLKHWIPCQTSAHFSSGVGNKTVQPQRN